MAGKRGTGPIVAVVVVFLLAFAVPAFAADGGTGAAAGQKDLSAFLNDLGKKVSGFKTLKTDFTQEKEMALFTNKIMLSGRIYLEKPNKIAWHVDKPLRYSVLITDKMIRQWDEDTNQVQEISLTKNPIFQNVLNQLTVWFSGEYGSLLESNTVRLLGHDPLVIECVPRNGNMAKKVIKSITITFRQDQTYLQRLRIEELNGDVTTIHFSNTLLNVPLDDSNFEVKPARERSSPTSLNGTIQEPALAAIVGRGRGSGVFSNGVCGHV
jgi:outer membrane lipoprotein-sorting protein